MKKNIGFLSFRFAGTDGVSLETEKWAAILEREGFDCYYFGGELETPPERSMMCDLVHFQHPVIRKLNSKFLITVYVQKILQKKSMNSEN